MTTKFYTKTILFVLSLTFLMSDSISDAFINVSELANPAVVSIIGKQDMEQTLIHPHKILQILEEVFLDKVILVERDLMVTR